MQIFRFSDIPHLIKLRLFEFIFLTLIFFLVFISLFQFIANKNYDNHLSTQEQKRYLAKSEVIVYPIIEKRIISDNYIKYSTLSYGEELFTNEQLLLRLLDSMDLLKYPGLYGYISESSYDSRRVMEASSIKINRTTNKIRIEVESYNEEFSHEFANYIANSYSDVLYDYYKLLASDISSSIMHNEILETVIIEPGKIIAVNNHVSRNKELSDGPEIMYDNNDLPINYSMLLMSVLLGLVFAGLIVLGKYFSARKIYDDLQLQESGIPFLGWVPLNRDSNNKDQIALYNYNSLEIGDEYIIPIFNKLISILQRDSTKVFGIVSTIDGEGKSFLCYSLADCFCDSNMKVLLVTNSQRGSLLSTPYNFSLTDILNRKSNLDEYFSQGNSLIGQIIIDDSELLLLRDRRKFKEIFDQLSETVDYVLFDIPSFSQLDKFTTFLGYVTSSIIVTRAGITDLKILSSLIKCVNSFDVSIIGAILNCVDPVLVSKESEIFLQSQSSKITMTSPSIIQRMPKTIRLYKKYYLYQMRNGIN
jgi:Mrp family chromosome partitioning ATPase